MKLNLFRFKSALIIVALIFFVGLQSVFAQQLTNDSTQKSNVIPLSEITFKYDLLMNELEDVKESAKIPKSIIKIDSNYQKFSKKVDSLASAILEDTSILSSNRISYLQKEWAAYGEKLHKWQIEISEHNRKVEIFKDSLDTRIIPWKNSLVYANDKKAPNEIKLRIQSAIDSISNVRGILTEKDKWLIIGQDKLISGQTVVNSVLDKLENQASIYRGSLFVLDSNPIWKWNNRGSEAPYWEEIRTSFEDQKRVLFLFFENYSWQFVFHFIIFLAFIWLFHFLKKRYSNADFPGNDNRIRLALISLNHPNISAIILGFMVSIYYYQSAPDVVFSLLTVLVAIPIIILFPRFIEISSRRFLYLIITIYLLQEIQQLFIVDHLVHRIVQLLKAGISIYVLSIAIKKQKLRTEKDNHYWQNIIKYLAPLFNFIAIASIVANIIGAYQLSEVLISGVINASTYAIIFVSYGILISSILIILLRSKYATSLQKFTKNNIKFEIKITGIVYLYMAYLWIRSTLVGFQLLQPVIKLYEDFIGLFWIIAGVKISVGGILSFLVILIVTFLLARLIKEIVNDNVIPVKSSGRGLPNAFSMVIRYMIVTLGVYIAMAAAGINLSEFGLIAGALGVGLGFGLQNILHNLVSGLIVSFERPIHVGDTVEVDHLHGVVTEIGVRSSKIRTFDGSEVILPNGDLLSKQVINWTLTDQVRRLEIKVRTSFDANPHEVIEMLKSVVTENQNVLPQPGPLCLFEGYGDSALNFRVLFWVQYNVGLSTKSDVALAIYDHLKQMKIEAPIPQQRLLYKDDLKPLDKPM